MKAHFLRRAAMWPALIALILVSTVHGQDGTKTYLGGMKSTVQVIVPVGGNRAAFGSGSVVNLQQGYILTNWHVVREGASGVEVMIRFPLWEKGRPVSEKDKYATDDALRKIVLRGKIIFSDEKVDLAIIKLVEPSKIPAGTASVRFAADSPFAGTKIVSIGNPAASDAMWIYTPGEVRSVYNKKWVSGSGGAKVGDHEAKIIEATSATSPGDSGGPCFNDKGEQVGVTQGGLSASKAQGFSYFIDSTDVKAFLKKNKVAFNMGKDAAPEMKEPLTMKDPAGKAVSPCLNSFSIAWTFRSFRR